MPDLSTDLFCLYQAQEGCDFTVQAEDGKSFGVHQLIISARSPVLKTMMSSDMKEKETSTITFKVMIEYDIIHHPNHIYNLAIKFWFNQS